MRPEIWGGIECTINRVGERYSDQLQLSGHYTRPDDLYRLAGLGIKTIRYPLLWEKHTPSALNDWEKDTPSTLNDDDWLWADNQLNLLQQLGINVIAGLTHHGSGPRFTSLDDPLFPDQLANYAKRVAERYPWLDQYTVVNEPLTTARFSGLYGFWYPHAKSQASFFRMLINQVKATILAMYEIRKINPGARLVQTEDLTFIHSTSALRFQANYENERRWLSYDLLCGMVDKGHYFWPQLVKSGISEKELNFFLENSCPPDIMGFNYYITSERYLDDRLKRYPAHLHGGNGRQAYADTEAIQAGKQKGLQYLLTEAWERYGIPLAVTECHIGCTSDEQQRWFKQNYDDCLQLLENGIDLRAITAWSLLGAYNWNNLLTAETGFYEAGAFEIIANEIAITPLGNMLQSLTAGKNDYDHIDLRESWWQKKLRQVRKLQDTV
ncbi:MAG: glycosyl hydrolase family protein [Chitinophagaceae bacterium]|nr:MAG: glycosyl hydrolase family protein [Chitinophagaceae bacterium]